ncbi:DUF397 domain-containing protein [Streptomyces malaysiense]|uniref:DUF397 domain-containing protein n=1 Tax=Streptomyces malaysiense TaxID=1428626 RepID=UPI0009A1134F|nr:DUF397 domain-containing protein [Streptomyces malaysiense]
MTAPPAPQWFKSSYSGGSGTECVECASVDGGALIRDSKNTEGPEIRIKVAPWRLFLGALTQRSAK